MVDLPNGLAVLLLPDQQLSSNLESLTLAGLDVAGQRCTVRVVAASESLDNLGLASRRILNKAPLISPLK